MKPTVFKVIFLLDVLEHTALLQPCSIEYRFTMVLSQPNLLQPLHKFTAKKTLHHSPLPTPESQKKHSPNCLWTASESKEESRQSPLRINSSRLFLSIVVCEQLSGFVSLHIGEHVYSRNFLINLWPEQQWVRLCALTFFFEQCLENIGPCGIWWTGRRSSWHLQVNQSVAALLASYDTTDCVT